MDLGGSSFPGEEPFEDPDGFGGAEIPVPTHDVDGGMPEGLIGDEDILRGWIPPDDRLWLHPSEIGRESRNQDLDHARRRARRTDRRGLLAAGVVGTAAITAAVAAVALAATSSGPVAGFGDATTPTHLTVATSASPIPDPNNAFTEGCGVSWMSVTTCDAVKRVEPSMLRIVVGKGTDKTVGTGVVVFVAGETVAITAASLVGTSASVEAFSPGGKSRMLPVLGVDDQSGIAVVKVPWAMPVVSIAQETVTPGQLLMLACLGRTSDELVPAMGQVNDADVTTQLMDSINVDITPVATPGGVLLDSAGDVLGILGATTSSANDDLGEFVPSWLALGVATKLTEAHQVIHGWLDVEGTTASTASGAGRGAYVVTVPASGPAAAAGLKPGDVVVGISGSKGVDPIESMADLRGRLYLEPPGARIELWVDRGSQSFILSPVLAAANP